MHFWMPLKIYWNIMQLQRGKMTCMQCRSFQCNSLPSNLPMHCIAMALNSSGCRHRQSVVVAGRHAFVTINFTSNYAKVRNLTYHNLTKFTRSTTYWHMLTMTKTDTKTKTKCIKDPTCARFLKSRGCRLDQTTRCSSG